MRAFLSAGQQAALREMAAIEDWRRHLRHVRGLDDEAIEQLWREAQRRQLTSGMSMRQACWAVEGTVPRS